MGIEVIAPTTTVNTNGQSAASTPASVATGSESRTTTETSGNGAVGQTPGSGVQGVSGGVAAQSGATNGSDPNAAGASSTSNQSPAGAAEPGAPQGQKLNVNVDPKSLEQITTLTATNRKLTKDLEDLRVQVASLTKPNTDIEAKLKRLEEFEKSPLHRLLALRNVTMEDVAKDVFEQSERVTDPRVEQALTEVQQLKAEAAAKAEAEKKRETEAAQARVAETNKQAIGYVDSLIKGQSDKSRWANIAKDSGVAERVFKACSEIVDRDFGEVKDEQGNVTRPGRRPTQEEAMAILHDQLDLEESRALALDIVKQRKNGGQPGAAVQPSRVGIAVSAAPETPGLDGSPPPAAPRAPAPAPGRTNRGFVSAREARRRVLGLVGGDE